MGSSPETYIGPYVFKREWERGQGSVKKLFHLTIVSLSLKS